MATMMDTRPAELDRIAGPRPSARLLVATDASSSADPVLRVARALASRHDAVVTVVAVHEPLPITAPDILVPVTPATDGCAALRLRVQSQLERLGIDEDWTIEAVTGIPAAVVTRLASELDASLIIVGLGGHSLFERIFGDEMVLKLLRLTAVPVLAVAPGLAGLPREVVVATDFSESSARAAVVAANIIEGGGRMTLAHALDKDADPARLARPETAFDGVVGRAFDLILAKLALPESERAGRRRMGSWSSRSTVAPTSSPPALTDTGF